MNIRPMLLYTLEIGRDHARREHSATAPAMSATYKLTDTCSFSVHIEAGLNAMKPACAGPGFHSWSDIEAIRRASRSRMRMPLAVAAIHGFDHLSNADRRIDGPSHVQCIVPAAPRLRRITYS